MIASARSRRVRARRALRARPIRVFDAGERQRFGELRAALVVPVAELVGHLLRGRSRVSRNESRSAASMMRSVVSSSARTTSDVSAHACGMRSTRRARRLQGDPSVRARRTRTRPAPRRHHRVLRAQWLTVGQGHEAVGTLEHPGDVLGAAQHTPFRHAGLLSLATVGHDDARTNRRARARRPSSRAQPAVAFVLVLVQLHDPPPALRGDERSPAIARSARRRRPCPAG